MIQFKQDFQLKSETSSLIIGIFTDYSHETIRELDHELNGSLSRLLENKLISTKFKTITPFYSLGEIKSQKIYIVGLGKKGNFTTEKCRQVFGKIAQSIEEPSTVLLDTFNCKITSIQELGFICSESMTLASYEMDSYKTEKHHKKDSQFFIYSQTNITQELERGIIYGEATNHARQLFNEPSNKLTATDLANYVADFSNKHQLECCIVDKQQMKELGMGAILGVNQGSVEPPKVVVAKYQGKETFDDITALVGKGITFDTGGYSLKSRAGMVGMNGDMGGAASAFGAFEIAVRLQLPVNLLLVIPTTDNMVSGEAIKPGDVLTSMSGKTIEVTNTDAEGRLILSDALTFANQLGASRIIDLATLTGAIIAALGNQTTGAFTNNQEFFEKFKEATSLTDEVIWQMPLFPRDQEALRCSEVADLNNSPTGKPGAIMAAAFLKEFVGDTPWIHLDIAGTAETSNKSDLGPKGGTGAMVRTIARYLELQSQI